MPNVNLNTGPALRWENAGLIGFGTPGSGGTPVLIVPGSLRIKSGRRERIPIMDRGSYTQVKDGNERLSEITFQVRPTSNGLVGANDLLGRLFPASASGLVTEFAMFIDVPDDIGGTVGTRATIASCWTEDGEEIQTAGDQNTDTLTIRIMSRTSAFTYSRF